MMARPGLEPGTPRFSGLRTKLSNKPKSCVGTGFAGARRVGWIA
jgi:hypothetical protein